MMRAQLKVTHVDASEYNESITNAAVCKEGGYGDDCLDKINTKHSYLSSHIAKTGSDRPKCEILTDSE